MREFWDKSRKVKFDSACKFFGRSVSWLSATQSFVVLLLIQVISIRATLSDQSTTKTKLSDTVDFFLAQHWNRWIENLLPIFHTPLYGVHLHPFQKQLETTTKNRIIAIGWKTFSLLFNLIIYEQLLDSYLDQKSRSGSPAEQSNSYTPKSTIACNW